MGQGGDHRVAVLVQPALNIFVVMDPLAATPGHVVEEEPKPFEFATPRLTPVDGLWDRQPLHPEVDEVAAGSFRDREPSEIEGSGYVVRCLEAALWAFDRSTSFEEGCLLAVNLGDDADTTAAVYGQLAGAFYGAGGIPESWLTKLAMRDFIVDLSERLHERSRRINQEMFEFLVEDGRIHVCRSELFDSDPQPSSAEVDSDRVEGMMLGLAIGDSLGSTSESMIPSQRRARRGEIRDYPPTPYAEGLVGLPSDDTQLAFWTLEQMLADGGFVPRHVAWRFTQNRIFGLGRTVREFLLNLHDGMTWYEAGPRSSGNGALMRIAPILIPHLVNPTRQLWVDTALCASMTHNDPASTACCLAFVRMLWELLHADAPPDPQWWLRTFVDTARPLEGDDTHYLVRGGSFVGDESPLWEFVDRHVGEAWQGGLSTLEACEQWHSGAYLLETMPCVLYILMRHADDPEEAIVRAVNDTLDNDTVAAIVGAAVGALHGRRNLPPRWIENLAGRTTEDDDGKVFQLLEQARRAWAG